MAAPLEKPLRRLKARSTPHARFQSSTRSVDVKRILEDRLSPSA